MVGNVPPVGMPAFCICQVERRKFHWYTPGTFDTRVTTALFLGVPVQPVMPKKIPATANV